MGEVFRAFDLKLRVEVALKAVRAEKVESERAREVLRREVRSAREVVSPNVCRIFDLVAEDGQELVSMEYIDGTTLGDTLEAARPPAAVGGPGDRLAVPRRAWRRSTRRASCTGTSSPRTSCSRARGASW